MTNKQLQVKIAEGEHQQQDFKYAINDSKKIARSLAAFANSDGGSLLLGVKDNGKVVGVASEEEFYMVEAAAQRYCKPPIAFETYEWEEEGKTVLEIKIHRSAHKPHTAPNKEGKPMVYVRVDDQNLLANKILLDYWKAQKKNSNNLFRLNEPEKYILNYLATNESITLTRFQKQARISYYRAQKIMVSLLCMKIINIHITEKGVYYTLAQQAGKKQKVD
ncbi:Putative DNA-binding domain-containing protein [Saccharicrinis carchari]|uniref:DNA-binding domain-containing protein n=1 Tax=Saccharicrinis carchari TaxID=1168039 RepID=A0A521DSW3_SACCC|nr:ATP-binding protein [Saccharicrinis carchari]SMO74672.1 Putative DNA-binding domain-containing protein [Saccharicrinis carchari]